MRKSFQFRDLADLFAKANEEKSGDQLAGLAAQSEQERVAAKYRSGRCAASRNRRQPAHSAGTR